jgi:aspartate racemase
MNIEKENVIGIVGGMGPEAGANLFNCIISHTQAGSDQEHLPVILMSFPAELTDRTLYLEGIEAVNPAYNVAALIQKLERAGANVIGIPCNTIHAPRIFNVILEELCKMNSGVRLLNMPVETCRYLAENHVQAKRIGIASTNGTYRSRIYENLLSEMGYEVIVPDPQFQHEVIHRMIYDPVFGIKSNAGIITEEVRLLLAQTIQFFRDSNAGAVVLGCTEISLAFRNISVEDMIIIDSTKALALALIAEATKEPERKTTAISELAVNTI